MLVGVLVPVSLSVLVLVLVLILVSVFMRSILIFAEALLFVLILSSYASIRLDSYRKTLIYQYIHVFVQYFYLCAYILVYNKYISILVCSPINIYVFYCLVLAYTTISVY